MDETSTPARRRLPPAEREKAILDGALALAREGGLTALTTRAVATRVGVAPALVAHYRPSMDAFVAEVFGTIVSAEREEVRRRLDPAAGVRENLLRVVDALVEEDRGDVTLIWVQAWAIGARNEALAERVRAEMDDWQRQLTADIVDAADGPADAARAADAAWLLLSMIDGMNAHSLVKWAPDGRAALARRAVSAILDAGV